MFQVWVPAFVNAEEIPVVPQAQNETSEKESPFQMEMAGMISPPALERLPEITNQAEYLLKGSAQPGVTVVIYTQKLGLNEVEAGRIKIDETGKFELPITFNQGDGRYSVMGASILDEQVSLRSGMSVEFDGTKPLPPQQARWSIFENSLAVIWAPPLLPNAPYPGMTDRISYYEVYKDSNFVRRSLDTAFFDREVGETEFHRYEVIAVDAAGNKSEPAVVNGGTFYQEVTLATKNYFNQPSSGSAFDAVLSKDGGKIGFISNGTDLVQEGIKDPGAYHLYVRDLNDFSLSLISKLDPANLGLSMNATGSKIAFVSKTSELPEDGNTFSDIYLYDSGKNVTMITEGEGDSSHPSLSDSGNLIAFQRESSNGSQIYLWNDSNRSLTLIGPGHSPSISGNGAAIAFAEGDKLFIYDILTKKKVELYQSGAGKIVETNLDSKGQTVAFTLENNGVKSVYLTNRLTQSTSEIYPISTDKDLQLYHPQLSGNGEYVLFEYRNDPLANFFGQSEVGTYLYNVQEKTFQVIGNPALITSEASINYAGDKVSFISGMGVSTDYKKRNVFVKCFGECTQTTPPPNEVPIGNIERWFSSVINGQAVMGSNLRIVAAGEKGKVLQAEIISKKKDGSSKTELLDLTEVEEGNFELTYQIPVDTLEITAVKIQKKDNPSVFKEMSGLPIKIAGQIRVKLKGTYASLLSNTKIIASSNSKGIGNQTTTNGETEYVIPVGDAEDYALQAISEQGQLLNKLGPISIANGEEKEINLELKAPARLKVYVKDSFNRRVHGVKVLIKGENSSNVYVTDINGMITLPGYRYEGETYELEALTEKPYAKAENQLVTLSGGENEVWFDLDILNEGTLSGKIVNEDQEVVSGLEVIFYNEKRRVSTKTNELGEYSINLTPDLYTIHVLQNEAPYYGITYGSNPYIIVNLDESKTKNLTVSPVGRRQMNVTLLSKKLDENWQNVDLKDHITALNYKFSVQGMSPTFSGLGPNIRNNVLMVGGAANDPVRACVDGVSLGFSAHCVDTMLNGSGTTDVELRIEEKARVMGSIVNYENPAHPLRLGLNYLNLAHIDETGHRVSIGRIQPNFLGTFSVSLAKEGKYQVEVMSNQYFVGVNNMLYPNTNMKHLVLKTFQLENGQMLDVGKVVVPEWSSIFAGKSGNTLEAEQSDVVPGGVAKFRGTYQYHGSSSLQGVSLQIQIPAGTKLIENSVVLNGEPVTVTKEGADLYSIPVGELTQGESGAIYYQLKVNEHTRNDIDTLLHISYRDSSETVKVETIESARVRVGLIDITVPEVITSYNLYVRGRGPINQTVDVYVDGTLVKQFKVSATGIWDGEIVLEEKAPSVRWNEKTIYEIDAKTTTDEGISQSSTHYMVYDPTHPSVTDIRIFQGIKTKTINTTNGIPKSFFSLLPSAPIGFEININQPERVKNVKLIAGSKHEAIYDPIKKKFVASIHPSIDRLSQNGVYVSYDIVPEPYQPKVLTDEMLELAKQELPEAWRNAEISIATEEDLESLPREETQTLTDDTSYTPYLKISMTGEKEDTFFFRMYFKRMTNYIPKEVYNNAAVPYSDFKYEESEITRKIRMSFVVPVSAYPVGEATKAGFNALGFETKGSTEHLLNGLEYLLPKEMGPLNKIWGIKDLFFDGLALSEFGDELLKFQDEMINSECHAPTVKYFNDQIELIGKIAINGTQMKYAIGAVAAGLGAFEVPALVGLATGTVSTVAGDLAVATHDRLFKELKEEFQKTQKWRDDMAKAGVLDRCKSEETNEDIPDIDIPDNEEPLIDMDWIYDPSGYVYEGMPSNRVKDVKATIFYKDEKNEAWTIWNAEPYEQINPQYTDELGAYAWDVPEGLWKVVYEKDDYEVSESAELRVLPPHFDVNIPLVSYEAPKVKWVRNVSGGQAIEVKFTKPIKVKSIDSNIFTVYDSNKQMVEGNVQAIDTEAGKDGESLAMVYRFIPTNPFSINSTYQVLVSKEATSYAGVFMDQDFSANILIEGALPPKDMVSNVDLVVGKSAIFLNWENTQDGFNMEYARLYWKKSGQQAYNTAVNLYQHQTEYVLTHLEAGTDYEIKLTTVNRDGLESEGVTKHITTLAEEKVDVDLEAPSEVENLDVQMVGTTLKVTWSDPIDEDMKNLLLSWKEKGSSVSQSTYVRRGMESYEINGLTLGKTYEINLKTIDQYLNASAGVTKEMEFIDETSPEEAKRIVIETERASATLTWVDPSDRDFSHVKITWQELGSKKATPQSMVVTKGKEQAKLINLNTGKTYKITIVTVDLVGNQSKGITFEKKILPTPKK
jgi:Tol biopolymer transport system component